MNKAQLIDAVASSAGSSKADAERFTKSVFDSITGALENGDSVTLVGFGTFSVNQREARVGKNPRTGDSINIAAKKVAKFKAGKSLSEAVNN